MRTAGKHRGESVRSKIVLYTIMFWVLLPVAVVSALLFVWFLVRILQSHSISELLVMAIFGTAATVVVRGIGDAYGNRNELSQSVAQPRDSSKRRSA